MRSEAGVTSVLPDAANHGPTLSLSGDEWKDSNETRRLAGRSRRARSHRRGLAPRERPLGPTLIEVPMSSSPPTESSPTGWSARSPAELLRDYLKVARRRWVVLVSITLLVAGIAVGVSLSGTKQYDATAKLLLQNDEPINDLLDLTSPSANDPERETNTELGLIKLETVAQRVRNALHLEIPDEDLLDKVKVETRRELQFGVAHHQGPRPAARGDAGEHVRQRICRVPSGVGAGQLRGSRRASGVARPDRRSEDNSQLDTRLRELQIASSLQTGGAEVVRLASPPTSPAAPRPLLSGVVGLIVGFLLAVVVVMLLEFADRRIKDEDEAQAVFGLPLLAQIPRPPRSLRRVSRNGDPLQDEGYANLAASLLFSRNEPLPRSLLVTSASAGDGKTTVTFGLARALTPFRQERDHRRSRLTPSPRRPAHGDRTGRRTHRRPHGPVGGLRRARRGGRDKHAADPPGQGRCGLFRSRSSPPVSSRRRCSFRPSWRR